MKRPFRIKRKLVRQGRTVYVAIPKSFAKDDDYVIEEIYKDKIRLIPLKKFKGKIDC